jgi:hypothetical protein
MDMMFEAYLTQEAGHLDPDDIPHTKDPVWILGKKYRAIDGDHNFVVNLFVVSYYMVQQHYTVNAGISEWCYSSIVLRTPALLSTATVTWVSF